MNRGLNEDRNHDYPFKIFWVVFRWKEKLDTKGKHWDINKEQVDEKGYCKIRK